MTKHYYAGSLVATRSGGTLSYIQPDHLGSASTVTDATGQVTARERFSAFGERRRGEAPTATDYLYTDQRYSVSVGFYHYSSGGPGRFYDALLGRFLQADPVTPGGGSQGLNRFAYVFNNPLNLTDPSGHDPFGGNFEEWGQRFYERWGFWPEDIDRLIHLYTLAYPSEGVEYHFYYHNGRGWTRNTDWVKWWFQSGNPGQWNNMDDALANLASHYTSDERVIFARDVATLWAGMIGRWAADDYPSHGGATYDMFVWIGSMGMDTRLIGSSGHDANVHHWAWMFAYSVIYGYHAAVDANHLLETTQYLYFGHSFEDYRADLELGGRAARFGGQLGTAPAEWFPGGTLHETVRALFDYFTFQSTYYSEREFQNLERPRFSSWYDPWIPCKKPFPNAEICRIG